MAQLMIRVQELMAEATRRMHNVGSFTTTYTPDDDLVGREESPLDALINQLESPDEDEA